VGRKWRMAHFVGWHQWVFSHIQKKRTQSQHTGEVTLNQQAALTLMWWRLRRFDASEFRRHCYGVQPTTVWLYTLKHLLH
jgi:hypothetical protein